MLLKKKKLHKCLQAECRNIKVCLTLLVINNVARLVAKNRSYGRDLLACENFVEDRYSESSRKLAQNPQHFLTDSRLRYLNVLHNCRREN